MRSGQYRTINVTDVREGEVDSVDRLSGTISFSWIADDVERQKTPIVGYVAYFKLVNGFEKSLLMSKEQIEVHANRYSQSYRRGFGQWKDDFDSMAKKTVIKLLISKYGPMSTDLERVIVSDQSVAGENAPIYIDNPKVDPEEVARFKETERIRKHIEKANTEQELSDVLNLVGEYGLTQEFEEKLTKIQNGK